MQINKEFLKLLEKEGLAKTPSQRARGLFFGFLITFKEDHPELKDYLLDDEEHRAIFPYDEFQIYQIKLCKTNSDNLQIELKVPMFEVLNNEEYNQFLELLTLHNVSSNGHLNLKLDFSIFDDIETDKNALEYIKLRLGKDFNLTKVVKVIANYYETTRFAKKLNNYLGSSAFYQDYTNFSE